jgi:hypothetical protein
MEDVSPGAQMEIPKHMKENIVIRFGRVMDQQELSNRISELTPEQYQAIVQVIQTNIEEIGSVIDGPALETLQLKHLAGGLWWSRTILEKLVNLRTPLQRQQEEEILVEI